MAKTTDIQIEKSRNLIGGLRRHLSERGATGFTIGDIDQMEQAVSQLAEASAEVDRLREELAPKVKHMNEIMLHVKTDYAEYKKKLKGYYPQERWFDYGIPDKR